MIIGVLSDTHGKSERTARAIKILQKAGAEGFIHCGDIGHERVLDEFVGLNAWFVWGNTDEFDTSLKAYAKSLGMRFPETRPLKISLDGKVLAVCHGHEREFEKLVAVHSDPAVDIRDADLVEVDYILHGHTHMTRSDRLCTGTRIVNPGALHRAGVFTVATIDLTQDEVRFWMVDDSVEDITLTPFEPWVADPW